MPTVQPMIKTRVSFPSSSSTTHISFQRDNGPIKIDIPQAKKRHVGIPGGKEIKSRETDFDCLLLRLFSFLYGRLLPPLISEIKSFPACVYFLPAFSAALSAHAEMMMMRGEKRYPTSAQPFSSWDSFVQSAKEEKGRRYHPAAQVLARQSGADSPSLSRSPTKVGTA